MKIIYLRQNATRGITKDFDLKILPINYQDGLWELVCFRNSDYAGNADTRWSVLGYILYVKGVPIARRSKAQTSVVLSLTEAKWIALSEAVKENMFVL